MAAFDPLANIGLVHETERVSDTAILFSELLRQGKIARNCLVGCSEGELASVEAHFGCALPEAYRDFLAIAGKGAGTLFAGSDIYYPTLLNLKRYADELLAELAMPDLLPPDAKVFCMHQGYELTYFLPASNDPPVFQFHEGQAQPTRPWNSMTAYFADTVEQHLSFYPSLDQAERGGG